MGKRRDRFDQRKLDQALSRSVNAPVKHKERERRNARMKAALKSGKFPYTRYVRNWMCAQLNKKESQLTPDDAANLAKA